MQGLVQMNPPDVVELTLQLCRIPSVTGQEAQVVRFVQQRLQQLGFNVAFQPVGHEQGRGNLLAHWPDCHPRILLTTHLDTVAPHFDPVVADDQQRLIGRGTCDAKGIAAAMMCAACRLLQRGQTDVGLLLLVGEETNSDGAKAAVHNFAPHVSYLIGGEPTELKLVQAMKGSVVFQLHCHGKAAHSAYPHMGHSALHDLVLDIQRLLCIDWPCHKELGDTTINVGLLQGGCAVNVLAAQAEAHGIVRCSVPAHQVVALLQQQLGAATQLQVKSMSDPLQLYCPAGFDSCVVAFGSDIPYLKQLGPSLLVGPGCIHDAHTDHEFVLVEHLHQAVKLYQKLCEILV
ncbi:MAG: M20/M25/M40 family metallo-hydrolase [Myxococcota bacterium]